LATIEVTERFLMTNASGEMRFAVGGLYRILADESVSLAGRASVAQKAADRRTEIGTSAASVLTAAAACDTFLSEYLTRGQMFRLFDRPTVDRIRAVQDAGDQWKALIRARAPDAKEAASFDPGASPEFEELRCLLGLRNHIAHRHSRLTTLDTWPTGLADCVRRKIIPAEQERFFDWATVAYRHQVAEWASAAAVKWIDLMERTLGFPC
jgi:hypothetical protein